MSPVGTTTTPDIATLKTLAEINALVADANKKVAETKLVPWQFAASAFTAGGALVGAIVAMLKLFGQ